MYSALLVGLAVTIGAPAVKDPPKKEASIVGVWNGEKMVRSGKDRPPPEGGITFTFTADGKVVVREGKREAKEGATYKVDTKKNPATIDLIPPADKKEPTMEGIFKIEGDTLTICFTGGNDAGERPTKFEAPEGSRTVLMILKRAKK